MVEIIAVLIIIGVIVIGILASPIIVKQRHNQIKRRPFPPLWTAIIENHLPIYLQLSPDERRRLLGHIQVFLAEKQFIGCAGLEVTLEMKVTIAAMACLLLLNERGKYFPKLHSILIYPSTYFVNETIDTGNYVVEERREARLGESWTQGQVILSWENVQKDTANWQDGHNVVLHEFAHQLDQEDGTANGVPILPLHADYPVWAQVMTAEYEKLCHDIPRKVKTVMDGYGTTNPAEFFAVATETFYEKPRQLQKHHPQLYEQLQRYYQLNPIHWTD
ncbi:zinc-dependent peptidase [Nodularia chucula]|uniref:M90 family metallopeptidase n=1 Tax=Nodularia chucula TaxID=3093667 RepID=UPI0039C5BEDD